MMWWIIRKWIYLTWHPVRGTPAEYKALIAKAALRFQPRVAQR